MLKEHGTFCFRVTIYHSEKKRRLHSRARDMGPPILPLLPSFAGSWQSSLLCQGHTWLHAHLLLSTLFSFHTGEGGEEHKKALCSGPAQALSHEVTV